MLNRFISTGRVKNITNEKDENLYKNIRYLNKTRITVNTDRCKKFCKNKETEHLIFKYDNKNEEYNVCVGVPILATKNLTEREIFNTMEFEIQEMDNNGFKIKDEWFQYNEFRESFIPSFCVAVYKYQGARRKEPYNIYDVIRMDRKQLYTALSRTTKFEDIHLNPELLCDKYYCRSQPHIEIINSRFNSLYSEWKIYKITFDDEKIYVGYTCENIETRLKWHLKNPNSTVYKHLYL